MAVSESGGFFLWEQIEYVELDEAKGRLILKFRGDGTFTLPLRNPAEVEEALKSAKKLKEVRLSSE